jgi:type I restriction enzyme S subunit
LLKHLPLASMNSDVAVPSLNRDRALNLEVQLPKTNVQNAIVSILSAYDDLIENNLRRMALLEKTARLIYNEWFVRLRFPGYEHTRVVDGVPEGWESHYLNELCRIGRGASPRPINNFMNGSVPWFKIGDATASDCPFIFRTKELVTEDGARKSIYLEPGSLILSNSATCGIPYFNGVSGCVHDGWLHFSDFQRVGKWFLYCYLFFKRDELVNSVSDGSTQKNLNIAAVGRLRVIIPKNQLLISQFEDVVKANFDAIINLSRQNTSLRAARDLLVPRLMSGEISV